MFRLIITNWLAFFLSVPEFIHDSLKDRFVFFLLTPEGYIHGHGFKVRLLNNMEKINEGILHKVSSLAMFEDDVKLEHTWLQDLPCIPNHGFNLLVKTVSGLQLEEDVNLNGMAFFLFF